VAGLRSRLASKPWHERTENESPPWHRRPRDVSRSCWPRRTAIFIDAGYFEKVIEKEFARAAIDYGKLVVDLAGGKDLLRAYYYNCPPYQGNPPSPDESRRKAKADKFYEALRRLPRFEVRLGRLEKRSCTHCSTVHFQQKRADLMLGVDLVNLSARQQISRAVLVAGDSDFLPAVSVAKDCGILVHLYHGGKLNPPHKDLHDACDDRSLIDQALIDRVRRGPSP
jgi:uncharacterized LabA/DUF88 family protein